MESDRVVIVGAGHAASEFAGALRQARCAGQIVGLSQDYDHLVVRGKPQDRSFMAFYLRGRRILAVDAVNRPAQFMVAKRLVAQKACVPLPEQLSDESWPLQNLNRAAATSHTG